MQSVYVRYAVLIAALMLALAVSAVSDTPDATAAPRWPVDPAVLETDGWVAGPASSEAANGAEYVSRDYASRTSNVTATLTISTSPVAKRIYRAGPEVPFLGSGYTVDAVPPTMVPVAPARGSLIARRGDERLLVIHTYGERRGRFDNGLVAWGFNILDTVLGRPNDYYLARVSVPLGGSDDDARAKLATALADVLFPRIATWYAQA